MKRRLSYADSCVCESVAKPLYYEEFKPAYFWCFGRTLCILR